MNTISIPIKEYKQTIRTQKDILSRLDLLQAIIIENSKDEVNTSTMKRFEKISLNLDKGNAKNFSSISSFRKYLKDL